MKCTTFTLLASAAFVIPAINSEPQARPTCDANIPIVFRSDVGLAEDSIWIVLLIECWDYILDLLRSYNRKMTKIRVVAQLPTDPVPRFIQAQVSSAIVTDPHAETQPVHIPCQVLRATMQGCAMSSLYDSPRSLLTCLRLTLFRAHQARRAETRSQHL